MKTARLLSAAAAIAAGVALLSPGGSSYAAWSDTVQLPGTIFSSGQLRLANSSSLAVVSRAGQDLDLATIDSLQVNDIVKVRLTSTVRAAGDALAAELSWVLDLGGLANDEVTTTVEAGGLEPTNGGWLVDKGDDTTVVTATVSIPIRAARADATSISVEWTLNQLSPSGQGTGWSDRSSANFTIPRVVSPEPSNPSRPEFAAIPVTVDTANNKNLILSWEYAEADTDAARWQVLQHIGGQWHPIEPLLASGTRQFTLTDALMNSVPAGSTSDFLVRFYPTGSGAHVDSTHAVRMKALSGASGRMEFDKLVPISEGSVP